MFAVHSTPTSVTLIVATLQDALLQQVRSLPLPVALSQLGHSLLEKEAVPPLARMEGDLGTGPRQRNDFHSFSEQAPKWQQGPTANANRGRHTSSPVPIWGSKEKEQFTIITGWAWRGFILFCFLFVPWKACWSSGCEPWTAAVSSHQALGESDSRIVSRYRVTSEVPLQKGLKCVYLDPYLLALFFYFFLLFIFILFSAFAPYHLFSSLASSALKHPACSSQRDQAAVALGRTTCSQPRDWKREKMR